MADNGTGISSRDDRDIAAEEAKIADIKEAIITAVLQGKDEVILDDGKTEIRIGLRQNEGNSLISIDAARFIKGQGIDDAGMSELKQELNEYSEIFELNKAKIYSKTIRMQEQKKKDSVKNELDKAIKQGNATPLRLGREITEGEDTRMMFKRMFGQKFNELYRVRGKGTHDFDYIGNTDSGKYEKVNASTTREGNDPLQKIIIMRKDGTFEEKTVDNLMVRGKYAIATDIPDSVVSERMYTYICVRTPGEKYLAIEALDSRNNNASSNELVKSNMTRARSVYEIEDVANAARLGEKINSLMWDGSLSAEEVELVKRLVVEQNLKEGEVIDFLNFVHDLKQLGLDTTQMKSILDSAKMTIDQIQEFERNGISDTKETLAIFYMMNRDNMSFEDAVNKLKLKEQEVLENRSKRYDEDDEKTLWGDAEAKRMCNNC